MRSPLSLGVAGGCATGSSTAGDGATRLAAHTSISGARVARELDALVRIYGKPDCIVSETGTEFTSSAILRWADENQET